MNKKVKFSFIGLVCLAVLLTAAWYLHRTNLPVLEPKGQVGHQELDLIIFGSVLSLVVIVPVFMLLFTFAWRYREGNPRAKERYRPELDHSIATETIWWLIPSALILVLSIVTWNSSHQLDPYRPLASSAKQMNIQVIALDWRWLFIYPEQHVASMNFVQFPQNTPVDFTITSDAPMNSFWIPQLGGQIYAMPGMTTQLHLIASHLGEFNGYSANISGKGFADMTFVAKSSTPGGFNNWVRTVRQSHQKLSEETYNKLLQPSEDHSVIYYSNVQNGLFDAEVMKYMVPGLMTGTDNQLRITQRTSASSHQSHSSTYKSMPGMST